MSSPNDHGQDIKAPEMRSVLGDAPTERLSMPFDVRVTGATVLGMLTGFTLGLTNAGSMAGLRFRAEHAHIFPTENAGWYLYHRSKNYHVILGGLKGGVKLGSKIGFWAGSFFLVEEAVDRYWQSKNFISSTVAGGTVAGAFSALRKCYDILFWATSRVKIVSRLLFVPFRSNVSTSSFTHSEAGIQGRTIVRSRSGLDRAGSRSHASLHRILSGQAAARKFNNGSQLISRGARASFSR